MPIEPIKPEITRILEILQEWNAMGLGCINFENGLYEANHVAKLGGPLTQNTTIDISDKYFFLGKDDFSTIFAIGDLSPLGGNPNGANLFANLIDIFALNDIHISADNNVHISVDNDSSFNVGNDAYFSIQNTCFINAETDAYLNAGINFSIGASYGPTPLENIRMLITSTNKTIQFNDVDAGLTALYLDMNDGQVLMPEVATFNFPNDAAAAAGGIQINSLYHNNGSVQIRLT
jgi:hypothetical protein